MGGAAMELNSTGIMATERMTDARMKGSKPFGGHRLTTACPAMNPKAMVNM